MAENKSIFQSLKGIIGGAKDKAIETANESISNSVGKITESAIDTATKAALNLGRNFGTPTAPTSPAISPQESYSYLKELLSKNYQDQPTQAQQPIQQPIYENLNPVQYNPTQPVPPIHQPITQPTNQQFRGADGQMYMLMPNPNAYNPYNPYPYYQPPQINFASNYVKLDETKLAARAKYETEFLLRIDKIVKGTIKFGGIKYFSKRVDADEKILRNYSKIQSPTDDDTKNHLGAIYRVKKLREIRGLSDSHEHIKEFLYDAVYEDLRTKNEAGTLQNINFLTLFAKENVMFAVQVFSPMENMQSFIDNILESDFIKNLESDVVKEILGTIVSPK